MKNRYFTGSFIFLVLLTCGILIKADSQIQQEWPRFRVALSVRCGNNHLAESLMESYIKRELRSLGDVEIVGSDTEYPLWSKLINIHAMEIHYRSGKSAEILAICTNFYNRIDPAHFAVIKDFYKRFPSIGIPSGSIAVHSIDDLESYCKGIVADFDKNQLQHHRDFRSRNPDTNPNLR